MTEAGPPQWEVPELDAPALAEVLSRHGVRFVVIGGFVAQMYVPEYATEDADFTPATDRDNLERLSRALGELEARVRTEVVPEGLPFSHDAASLARASMWNLQCKHGAFDITFEPAGGGYDHLARRAKVVTVRGVQMPLADLADIVESKRLANRPKDLAVLPLLEDALMRRDRPAGGPERPRRPTPEEGGQEGKGTSR